MSDGVLRARLLLQQGRFADAEGELRRALTEDPDSADAQALLAMCLLGQESYEAALYEAKRAVVRGPDQSFSHYALARTLAQLERHPEAEAAIREAVRLQPEDPDYLGFLAAIQLEQEQVELALRSVEQGLALDPEHDLCVSLRARILIHQGRGAEAEATLEERLRADPEDAYTHAALGLARLNRADYRGALESYREALRLDPSLDMARAGLVQAMKARYRVYGLFLRYLLFMQRLTGKQRWMLILGLYFGYRMVLAVSESVPALQPWVRPVMGLYLGFVLLSWTASPLFDLLLSFNRFGRYSLTEDQRRASRWVAVCLLGAVTSGVLGLSWAAYPGTVGALASLACMVPLVVVYASPPGPRAVWGALTVTLVYLASTAIGIEVASSWVPLEARQPWSGGAVILGVAFAVGVGAVTFLGNLSPSFMQPRLGKLPPRVEDAERGRFTLLFAAVPTIALALLIQLSIGLLGGSMQPVALLLTGGLVFAVRGTLQGSSAARWGLVALALGAAGYFGVYVPGSYFEPVTWFGFAPAGVTSLAFAVWVVASRRLTVFVEEAQRRRAAHL